MVVALIFCKLCLPRLNLKSSSLTVWKTETETESIAINVCWSNFLQDSLSPRLDLKCSSPTREGLDLRRQNQNYPERVCNQQWKSSVPGRENTLDSKIKKGGWFWEFRMFLLFLFASSSRRSYWVTQSALSHSSTSPHATKIPTNSECYSNISPGTDCIWFDIVDTFIPD